MAVDIHDPGTQKTIILIIVPVVVLYLFYSFLLKPLMSGLEEKEKEFKTESDMLSAATKTTKSLDFLVGEIDHLNSLLEKYQELLPDKENVARLIEQISEVERQTNIIIRGFNAQETAVEEGLPFSSYNYQLTIEGGYYEFANFLAKAMNLPRIMSFKDIKIEAGVAGGAGEGAEMLQVDCTLVSYVYKGGTPAEQVGNTSPGKRR